MKLRHYIASLGDKIKEDNPDYVNTIHEDTYPIEDEIDYESEKYKVLASLFDANTPEGMAMIRKLYA